MSTARTFNFTAMKVVVSFDEIISVVQVNRMSTTMFEFKQLIFDTYGIPVCGQMLYEYKGHFDTPLLNDGSAFDNLQVQNDEIALRLVLRSIKPTITIEVKVRFSPR